MGIDVIHVVMPQMGEAISEATIVVWRRKIGDAVEEGTPLLDISTAKVEVEIPAPESGILSEILYAEGDTVPIDTVIAHLLPPGSAVDAIGKASPEPEKKPVSNGTTSHVPKSPTPRDEPTPKATADVAASTTPDDTEREREHLMKRRSSPLVRRMASELGIDVSRLKGSGIHGRVTRNDLDRYLAEAKAAAEAEAPPPAAHSPHAHMVQPPPGRPVRLDTVAGMPGAEAFLPPSEEPVSVIRRQIAEQMVKSVQNIPQAFTVHEVDFTQLEKMRQRQKNLFEAQYRARLTPLVFLIRAIADGLLQCPYINASWGGDRIVLHRNVNIGLAVAIRGGLVVPVLKCVETMSLAGIAQGVVELARKAREGKLSPRDMDGATFTITSPGQLGAVMGIPIVNRPQGGILHFGAIRKVPAVIPGEDGEDTLAIRQRAMLTLGIDHRLIDGWEADKFMVVVKDRIQRTDFQLPA